jgi:hypothetical protein
MCFSATASFTASVVLIPLGVYCVKKAIETEKPYWAIAILPFVFGLQQGFEGLVWLEMEPEGSAPTRFAALGFMFFSHVFWLIWIPFACYIAETDTAKRKIFFALIFIGAVHGLLMYIPLWVNPDWLTVELVNRSIDYKATLLYDQYMPRIVVRVIYAVIVLIPLLFTSDQYIRIFGVLIAVSVAVATVYFGYAFISIWCYFAAILSIYILFMVRHTGKAESTHALV